MQIPADSHIQGDDPANFGGCGRVLVCESIPKDENTFQKTSVTDQVM